MYKRPLSDFAFSQLCAKLGIPVRYMKKCLDNGAVDLAIRNVNEWIFKNGKTKFLIREFNGMIRGILSNRYSTLDTPEILDVAEDVLGNDYKVKEFFMNEERFHVRLIEDELNVPEEDLFIGIQIDSSDVGKQTLLVQFFVYKQICSNGLVIPKLNSVIYKQRHVGIDVEEFKSGFEIGLRMIDSLKEEVEKAIIESKDGIDNLELELLIEKFKNMTKVSKETVDKIVDIVNSNKYGERSRWSLVNSITEVAQDFTLDRRIELEKFAGMLLVA
ncbi:MAG: hypothetical protein H0Z24_05740 [Thermosipho sp. (in: Bacteria)]|nr:hypothetical protein [Thermosipho sp. (in: thermotogales)]